jgi:hypothetical protein
MEGPFAVNLHEWGLFNSSFLPRIRNQMPDRTFPPVCTENLGPDAMVMKSTKNRV